MSAQSWWKSLLRRKRLSRLPDDAGAWLQSNTFHHSQFADLSDLVKRKEQQRLRISLCIPTLNEERTIGKTIVIFKSELMSRFPLLDEIAVIDSGSTDNTMKVAAEFGAAVYRASAILPSLGSFSGKGENLWKAIYQLKGDILVYVDADIKNIRARFVSGLVGPLLHHPTIGYVKAFYDRPLVSSGKERLSGGGRVTEILVRPLFSLFFPKLTALIQPLSGEYAVRREVLERLSFPVGYGIETAHLIDVYRQWGMKAIGQTDLDQRVHRNQDLHALGRMSAGILQVFFARLRSLGIIANEVELKTVLKQFRCVDTKYSQVDRDISSPERPPMIGIPAYRRKRKLEK